MDDFNKKDNNEIPEPVIEKEKFILIGQLLSGMMHNLNTPLMGSAGQLILSDRKSNKIIDKIKNKNYSEEELLNSFNEIINHNNNIRNYLFYMSDVISAVKSYIKTTDSKDINSFTIQELFDKVQLLTSYILKKNKISYTFDIDSSLSNVEIKGELNSLIQVMINLIDNAIASYEGKIGIIEIKSYQEIKNNKSYIKISVKDHGIGIKKELHSKILNEMITTKGKHGTGIGLYLSNMIIKDKFNGSIEFKSEYKKGTIMLLSLKPNIKENT